MDEGSGIKIENHNPLNESHQEKMPTRGNQLEKNEIPRSEILENETAKSEILKIKF